MSQKLWISSLLVTASGLLAAETYQEACERTLEKYGHVDKVPSASLDWLAKTYKKSRTQVRVQLDAIRRKQVQQANNAAMMAKRAARARLPSPTSDVIAFGSKDFYEQGSFVYQFIGGKRVRLYPRSFTGNFAPQEPGKPLALGKVNFASKGKVAPNGSIGTVPGVKGGYSIRNPFAGEIKMRNPVYMTELQKLSETKLRGPDGKTLPASKRPAPKDLGYWILELEVTGSTSQFSDIKLMK